MGTDSGRPGSRRSDCLKGRDPGAGPDVPTRPRSPTSKGVGSARPRRRASGPSRPLERDVGRDHPELAVALNNLVRIRLDRGDPLGAEESGRRAVTLARADVKGIDSQRSLAQSLDHLAGVCRVLGRYDEAESLYRKALILTKSFSGPDGLEIAALLNNLAVLHKFQGRFVEAGRLYRQALRRLSWRWARTSRAGNLVPQPRRPGARPPPVRPGRTIRAPCLGIPGTVAWARPPGRRRRRCCPGRTARRAGKVRRSRVALPPSPGHAPATPRSGSSRGCRCSQQPGSRSSRAGRRRRGRRLYRQALVIKERVLGRKHPDVALTLYNLSVLQVSRGDAAARRSSPAGLWPSRQGRE